MSNSKVAIVTRGSRGIGRNTVLCLAQRGTRSILTDNSNRAEAEKAVTLAAEAGAGAIALQLDTGRAGVPDDVGPVIAGLLSDDFGWVNAQRIEVAGGMQI